MLRIWLATVKERQSWPIISIIHIMVHKLAEHPPSPLTLREGGIAPLPPILPNPSKILPILVQQLAGQPQGLPSYEAAEQRS